MKKCHFIALAFGVVLASCGGGDKSRGLADSASGDMEAYESTDVKMKDVDFTPTTGSSPVIVFADPEAGQQAVDVFETVLKKLVSSDNYYNPAWSALESAIEVYQNGSSLSFPGGVLGPSSSFNYPAPGTYYFGVVETDGKPDLKKMRSYNLIGAAKVAAQNRNKERFLAKLSDFVDTAIDNPGNLDNCYRNIEPWEVVSYVEYLRDAVYALADSVYLIKPELTKEELANLFGFVNNCLMAIGADYGIANMGLEQWAKNDVLNMTGDAEAHKADYERIIKMNERALKDSKSAEPYHQAMQLAALCGLGRWKEAAAYFPKVHRVVTDNGLYIVPYELDYMKDQINKRGFKVVVPNYSKGAKVNSRDPNLIEFFVSEAIEAGVRHYEKKRAERKAREFFYESIGLDKKGRPKK